MSTQIDAVFDALVADIVRGTYPPGTRLPAERELSRMLGASRPTLREALRRLDEWNLVSARRGSGIVVREVREWMIEVLPVYLAHGQPGPDRPTIGSLVSDLLLLRRFILVDMLRALAGRVPPGGTATARAHVERAWQMRADGPAFAAEDFQIIRALAEAAGSLPAMWMVNRLSAVYLDIARRLSGAIAPPPEYLEVHDRMLTLLEAGDHEGATREIGTYLERHDQRILAAFGGAT
ncbi:MAG TPA: GntR family transcriptional regulator [Kofleriaceae bacterium]|nr:GntR family transcriptional regulator [Kofleriaceae bacterium]